MYERLVLTGRGWGYIPDINRGGNHFRLSLMAIDAAGNHGAVAQNNATALAESVNIFNITTYYGWEIFITIVFNLILYWVIVSFYKKHPIVNQGERLFIYLNIIVLNIFCFCMAKEFFQMIFWFITMWAIKGAVSQRKGVIKVALALFVTVLFTRKYYALVFIYFLLVRFFIEFFFRKIDFKRKSGKYKLFFSVILLMVIMAGMYYVMSDYLSAEAEETYAELERVNMTQRIEADSVIMPIFNRGGTFIMTVEYFLKIFRLMFPVELLFRFKLTYLITIIYQGMLFYVILKALRNRKGNKLEKNLAVDLYIAFWLTSAAFEPDFGSWIRHQSVVLPVMLYMLGDTKLSIQKM